MGGIINKAAYILAIFVLTNLDQSGNEISGTYRSIFDSSFKYWSPFELIADSNGCRIANGKIEQKYLMKKQSENNWFLVMQGDIDTTNMTRLEKELNSLGTPFYDITMVNIDTVRFKYMRNLHILICSGILVRNK